MALDGAAPTPGGAQPRSSDGVKPSLAVEKALKILDAFLTSGHTMGVSELSRMVRLPKSTCFRLVRQLAASQYLARTGDDYRLGSRLLSLGSRHIHMQPGGLADVAAPHLGTLLTVTAYAVHLGALDGDRVLILSRLQTQRMPQPLWAVGESLPASTSSLGKILLALGSPDALRVALSASLPRLTPKSVQSATLFHRQLERARLEGCAYDLEETVVGVVSVAAPIYWRGAPIAAVAASGPAQRFQPATAKDMVSRIAHAIERDFVRQRHVRDDADF